MSEVVLIKNLFSPYREVIFPRCDKRVNVEDIYFILICILHQQDYNVDLEIDTPLIKECTISREIDAWFFFSNISQIL